jgi:hypothetical protein
VPAVIPQVKQIKVNRTRRCVIEEAPDIQPDNLVILNNVRR